MLRRQLFSVMTLGGYVLAESKKARVRLTAVKRTAAREERRAVGYEFTLNSDEPFAVRALDPVLEVGAARLTQYRYGGERGNELIFIATPEAELTLGANMRFQYGEDASTRVELGAFRGETKQ
jgi:hypothetical protein